MPAASRRLAVRLLAGAAPVRAHLGTMAAARAPLSWSELEDIASTWPAPDLANGPSAAQSRLRLFGQPEEAVRVTLFRDNHAWCPYCQKVGAVRR